MLNKAYADYKPKQFLTEDELTHFAIKTQLHTLSVVAIAKANGEKKINILAEEKCYNKNSFDWAITDGLQFF